MHGTVTTPPTTTKPRIVKTIRTITINDVDDVRKYFRFVFVKQFSKFNWRIVTQRKVIIFLHISEDTEKSSKTT